MTSEQVFVRGVWMNVPSEDDVSWVRRVAALPLTEEPLGDYGALVKRMLECGLSEYEIARFAKIVGYETAFGIAYLLDDPAVAGNQRVSWRLYEVDEDTQRPVKPLVGAHEEMLSMDPSGREMRPRGSGVTTRS